MPCHHCKRSTKPFGPNAGGLGRTRDHYPVPKSRGGTETVRACFACNSIKGAMSEQEWLLFMRENPSWWTLFRQRPSVAPPRRAYVPDPDLVRITLSRDYAMRLVNEGPSAAQDLRDLGKIEWPWLRDLVGARISQVGLGPWQR